MITQELVKELLEYRDDEIYWKVKRSNRVDMSKPAGRVRLDGYRQIKINGKMYKNHRIIFLMFHGYLPKFIDHIDNNRSNNHIENLREATESENSHNAKLRKDNTSGVKGVCWNKRNKKWRVQLQINNNLKSFGRYHDLEVAKFIAETMRYKYHGQFANHG